MSPFTAQNVSRTRFSLSNRPQPVEDVALSIARNTMTDACCVAGLINQKQPMYMTMRVLREVRLANLDVLVMRGRKGDAAYLMRQSVTWRILLSAYSLQMVRLRLVMSVHK